eukprot:CAMPEP_0197199090 /NCGR_PEP_ID=MMETSP1423-20130617/33708_1 /TAXON_ID=476441 /ORGANISM="Pseudo-nitzschia heimii, Strain UNC1101" /LENGTH=330 /DNA_ID=CAMNT_0042652941 /DNA_START=136 /DNA_END=1128 /DNA_ORIENTATION=+
MTIKTLIHRSSSGVALAASKEEEDEEETVQSSPPSSAGSSDAKNIIDENQSDSIEKEQTVTIQSQLQTTQRGPSAEDLMLAMGTNPRRIVLGVASATGIALAGNLLGVTSKILTLFPENQVEATGLDTYFPRGDYKRCRAEDYTFLIPKEWVADTYVELAKAQRKVQPLDYSMQASGNSNSKRGKISTLPDSAYGPPGRLNQKGVSQQGDTNVSVIVSSGLSGFSLQGTLGSPKDAAETLLSNSIAPEGSGRVATLLRSVEDRGGQTYKFEYIVDRGTRGPPLQNIAVIAASPKGDKLYTLTVVAPAAKWKDATNNAKFCKIADSFHLRL